MSMIQKRILVGERLRRPPATGWSWVDRRFLREQGVDCALKGNHFCAQGGALRGLPGGAKGTKCERGQRGMNAGEMRREGGLRGVRFFGVGAVKSVRSAF